MEDSGRSMHRLQRPVVWILCLVFSMFGRISGYFLLGIIGLFWFHFERNAPSEWLYLPLCIFKCKESRPVKQHNPAVNSKWGTLIVPLGFERLDFFISGFFNIFLGKPYSNYRDCWGLLMTKLTQLSLQFEDTSQSINFSFISHMQPNRDFNIAIKTNH